MALTAYTLPTASDWKLADNIIGVDDVAAVYTAGAVGAPGIVPLPSAVIENQLGCIVKAISYNSTYGGQAQLIFLAVPTSTTVTQGLAYTYKGSTLGIVVVPTAVSGAAVSGLPVCWALNSVTSNATSIQYTWFFVQGRCAALKTATIAAQPDVPLFVSGATAGRVRTTASIFRTILGARSANTATASGSVLPIVICFPSIGPGV